MDKPNKGNTIKIKLNGETPPQLDVPPKEVEASIDPIPKVIKINSNLSESDNFMETAAAQESVDESFDWIIPESSENDIEEFKIVPSQSGKKSALPKITTFSSNTKKKNGRPLGTILISAVFAILIGTTIGVVMLKLVITTPTDKTVVTEPTVVTEKPASTTETKTTEGKNSSAAISQVTAYVIQGGVFSSEAGAKETSSSLDSKGIPSQTVEMDGKYFLFLGVADSIEAAKALGGQYKENGIEDVFAKPLLLDEKKFTGVTEKEKTFLKAVPTIYQTLSLTSSSALLTKSLSEDSSKALIEIEEQLKSSVKNKKLKDLKAELVSANEKLKAFQESKSEKNLSDAQQHLLNFMSLYFSK
ncbi:SPOR domain-containing protein [Bacillus sp. ISL-40]|uniref:SPOR domain-containing protein n=1 Tax=unclassified Bacillus (in: firmicutes) TaxID=185979 RepID=UPI001BE7F38A|nr:MULTISPECIES: SPOR domain-containing protein [unclassified Bacillus (in: firmicutes)]MBT2697899.1 SPOR domain-containing protein [Bacillus sp. ISL-40]MBT2721511.1 SPOR domain-containing protein [Bacillus sp. ISL-46]